MEKRIVNQPETLDGYRVVQEGEEIFKALQNNETVMHWESGNSMHPILMNMEYCKIIPMDKNDIVAGMPVFCRFYYRNNEGQLDCVYMVHRCTEIIKRDEEFYFRIEGTDGTFFGWTKDVYGVAESTNVFQDDSVFFNF